MNIHYQSTVVQSLDLSMRLCGTDGLCVYHVTPVRNGTHSMNYGASNHTPNESKDDHQLAGDFADRRSSVPGLGTGWSLYLIFSGIPSVEVCAKCALRKETKSSPIRSGFNSPLVDHRLERGSGWQS